MCVCVCVCGEGRVGLREGCVWEEVTRSVWVWEGAGEEGAACAGSEGGGLRLGHRAHCPLRAPSYPASPPRCLALVTAVCRRCRGAQPLHVYSTAAQSAQPTTAALDFIPAIQLVFKNIPVSAVSSRFVCHG
eukprot:3934525-Rhodomonas_salina.1